MIKSCSRNYNINLLFASQANISLTFSCLQRNYTKCTIFNFHTTLSLATSSKQMPSKRRLWLKDYYQCQINSHLRAWMAISWISPQTKLHQIICASRMLKFTQCLILLMCQSLRKISPLLTAFPNSITSANSFKIMVLHQLWLRTILEIWLQTKDSKLHKSSQIYKNLKT
jgi:hypothetical protein